MSRLGRAYTAWSRLRQGERIIFFMVAVMLVFGAFFWLAAITGVTDVMRVRDVYEATPETDEGFHLVRDSGCRNCHTILKIGEWGLGPVLDGEGTRRDYMWLRAYLEDPVRQMNGKSLHDGRNAPGFEAFTPEQKDLIATFLFSLKALPGSANYTAPPE